MIDAQILIKNKLGLHARAAVKFVNLANRFQAHVKIIKDGSEIDGKSILGILTRAAPPGRPGWPKGSCSRPTANPSRPPRSTRKWAAWDGPWTGRARSCRR